MNKSITLNAEISLPLDLIVEAVGPEISRAMVAGFVPPAKRRPPDQTLQIAVDNVVKAYERLEQAKQTPGERNAHEHLDQMLRVLASTTSKIRRK